MSSCDGPGCEHSSHATERLVIREDAQPEDLVAVAQQAAEAKRAREDEELRKRRARLKAIPKFVLRVHAIRNMTPEQFEAWAGEHPADIARIRAAMEKRTRKARQKDWRDWMSRACSGKELAVSVVGGETK